MNHNDITQIPQSPPPQEPVTQLPPIRTQKGDKKLWILAIALVLAVLLMIGVVAIMFLSSQMGNNSSSSIHVEMSRWQNQANWTFTVTFIDDSNVQGATLHISDVRIDITAYDESGNATRWSSIPLIYLTSGTYSHGIKFTNIGDPNLLDHGDYFTIDKALYPSGIISLESNNWVGNSHVSYYVSPFW